MICVDGIIGISEADGTLINTNSLSLTKKEILASCRKLINICELITYLGGIRESFLFYLFLIFIEFIGVKLVDTII